MASILTLAAEAVKDELNAKLTSWGYGSTTATRKNTTKFVLEELDSLAVTVLPIVCPVETRSKTSLKWSPTVDIDIRKRTNDDTDAEDALVELSETIAAHFLQTFASSTLKVITAEPSVTVPSEELQDKGLFAMAVRLTLMAQSSGES